MQSQLLTTSLLNSTTASKPWLLSNGRMFSLNLLVALKLLLCCKKLNCPHPPFGAGTTCITWRRARTYCLQIQILLLLNLFGSISLAYRLSCTLYRCFSCLQSLVLYFGVIRPQPTFGSQQELEARKATVVLVTTLYPNQLAAVQYTDSMDLGYSYFQHQRFSKITSQTPKP